MPKVYYPEALHHRAVSTETRLVCRVATNKPAHPTAMLTFARHVCFSSASSRLSSATGQESMQTTTDQMLFETREAFRKWLRQHHDSSSGIWLVLGKSARLKTVKANEAARQIVPYSDTGLARD